MAAAAGAQVPFDASLRHYRQGDMWEFEFRALLIGITTGTRVVLTNGTTSSSARTFQAECYQKMSATGPWSLYRTQRIRQHVGSLNLDTGDPTRILLPGSWLSRSAVPNMPDGTFIYNPRYAFSQVGRQTIPVAGRNVDCMVFRSLDGRGGVVEIWLNTRIGTIVKQAVWLRGVQLSQTTLVRTNTL